jgi:integrase
MDFPAYRRKGKGRVEKTYQQVRETESRRLSTATISADMTTINGFLSWAAAHGYLETNPLDGMLVTRDKDDEVRDPFSKEDLQLIFSQPRFQGHKSKKQSTPVYEDDYWLPLLALFTGARLEELCRLRKKDIRTEGSIHYFEIMPPELAPEISTRKKRKAGKTKAAHRCTPIHPALMETLGFREFVESKPEGYLFTLNVEDTKRGSESGRDFSRFKAKLGFDKAKVFHSFRHTIRDALTAAGVSGEFIKGIVGHSLKDDVTFGRYGSQIQQQPSVLASHLYRVNFDEVLEMVKPWGEIKGSLNLRVIKTTST